MNPFRSLRDYEVWIYSLPQRFSAIAYSTLLLAQRGRQLAELTGEIAFSAGCRLVVYERRPCAVDRQIRRSEQAANAIQRQSDPELLSQCKDIAQIPYS